MSPQSLTQPAQEVLIALVKLNQTPGTMFNKQTLAKKWCAPLPGREQPDLERAIEELVNRGHLRENALKTTIGFTSAGYVEGSTLK